MNHPAHLGLGTRIGRPLPGRPAVSHDWRRGYNAGLRAACREGAAVLLERNSKVNHFHENTTRNIVHQQSLASQRAARESRAQLAILVAVGLVIGGACLSPALLGMPALFAVLSLGVLFLHRQASWVRWDALSKPPSMAPVVRRWRGVRGKR